MENKHGQLEWKHWETYTDVSTVLCYKGFERGAVLK